MSKHRQTLKENNKKDQIWPSAISIDERLLPLHYFSSSLVDGNVILKEKFTFKNF